MQSQIQRHSDAKYQDTEESSKNIIPKKQKKIIPRTTPQYIYMWRNLKGGEYIGNCLQRSKHLPAAYASLEEFVFSQVILTTVPKSFHVV